MKPSVSRARRQDQPLEPIVKSAARSSDQSRATQGAAQCGGPRWAIVVLTMKSLASVAELGAYALGPEAGE